MKLEFQDQTFESEGKNSKESDVHLLPCSIKYDGNAPVKDFFKVKAGEGKAPDEASFHGRSLLGKEVPLQGKLRGLILSGGLGNGQMNVDGNFSKVHMWEHDVPPETAVLEDCLHWFEVAAAVHGGSSSSK